MSVPAFQPTGTGPRWGRQLRTSWAVMRGLALAGLVLGVIRVLICKGVLAFLIYLLAVAALIVISAVVVAGVAVAIQLIVRRAQNRGVTSRPTGPMKKGYATVIAVEPTVTAAVDDSTVVITGDVASLPPGAQVFVRYDPQRLTATVTDERWSIGEWLLAPFVFYYLAAIVAGCTLIPTAILGYVFWEALKAVILAVR